MLAQTNVSVQSVSRMNQAVREAMAISIERVPPGAGRGGTPGGYDARAGRRARVNWLRFPAAMAGAVFVEFEVVIDLILREACNLGLRAPDRLLRDAERVD